MILDSVALHETKFTKEIELFLSNTDLKYWAKIIKKIDAFGGLFYKHYLRIQNPLAEGIRQYLDLLKKGQLIWKHRSHEIDYLAQNAFIVNRILNYVSVKARNEIISKLKSEDIRYRSESSL